MEPRLWLHPLFADDYDDEYEMISHLKEMLAKLEADQINPPVIQQN